MKKLFVRQIWLLVCAVVILFVFLSSTFYYEIQYKNPEKKYETEMITMEFSEFCINEEKRQEWIQERTPEHELVDHQGRMLENNGIGAKSRYTPFSFIGDVFERFLDNCRFDLSALLVSPFKNLLVYAGCLVLSLGSLFLFGKGIYRGSKNLYFGWRVKKGNYAKAFTSVEGTKLLFAPIGIWGAVELFRFYNSYSLENLFLIENTISTKYASISLLGFFIGVLAIYWIGYTIIGKVVKEKNN